MGTLTSTRPSAAALRCLPCIGMHAARHIICMPLSRLLRSRRGDTISSAGRQHLAAGHRMRKVAATLGSNYASRGHPQNGTVSFLEEAFVLKWFESKGIVLDFGYK